MCQKIEGVIPILQSPFQWSGDLDLDLLSREVRFLGEAGVQGRQHGAALEGLHGGSLKTNWEAMPLRNLGGPPAFWGAASGSWKKRLWYNPPIQKSGGFYAA